jgi:ribosomal protein S14
MNSHFGVTDPPLLRFLIHAAHISRGACLVSKGGQPSDARLGTIQRTVLLETADAFGSGSFSDISSHEMTRLPSSMTFRRRCDRCNRSRFTLAKGPAISSDAVWTSCRPSASCTVASFVGAVFRYAVQTSTALPDDYSSFLPLFLARRRSWVLLPFAGLFPRMGGWHFCPSGPTCRFDAARPPRLIFVGVTDRPGWNATRESCERRSAGDLVFGVAFDFWALTPICDPHPPACGRRTDPALGFASCRVCGRESAHTIGLDPESHHRPPGSGASLIVARIAGPNPLMRFRRCFAGPFSVLMGPMPGLA